MNIDEQIKKLSLELPTAPKAAGVYRTLVIVDSLAYVSGHRPLCTDGTMLTGRVGSEVDLQGGYQAAR